MTLVLLPGRWHVARRNSMIIGQFSIRITDMATAHTRGCSAVQKNGFGKVGEISNMELVFLEGDVVVGRRSIVLHN